MAKLLGGDGTEPGPETVNRKERSYTLFPVSLQRYSTEGKFVEWMKPSELDFAVCCNLNKRIFHKHMLPDYGCILTVLFSS